MLSIPLCCSDYEQRISANHSLEIYEGTYGNFAYGNITVTVNDTLGLLQMRLGHIGVWNLHPWGGEHAFVADGIDDIWPMDVRAVFESTDPDGCTECIDILNVHNFDNFPHAFERDLKMSDAPPPPSTRCDEVSGGYGGDTSGWSPTLPSVVYSIYGLIVQHMLRQ